MKSVKPHRPHQGLPTTSVRPKKRLGQNFLTAPYHAERIAASVPDGGTVLEIGPGTGALSIHLQKRFPAFHCLEFDDDVVVPLREKLGEGPWTLHRGDALRFDFSALSAPLNVVGNLPYNIAAHILRRALSAVPHVSSVTFMVQKEVALRIVEEPGSKTYGFLSVFCAYFGTPELLFTVPPGAFFPKPKVDSAVFRIVVDPVRAARLSPEDREAMFALVSAAFEHRRKTLSNAIAMGRPAQNREWYAQRCAEASIDAQLRPECLSVEQWIDLHRAVAAAECAA